MLGADQARRYALSLPGAVEQDHHGFPSFRVAEKIFATLPAPQVLRVFVEDESIQSALQRHPDCCEPVRWGAKVLGVAFDLDVAGHELVEEYLTEAWASRATPPLLAQWDSGTQSQ
ncbi:MAG: MmcQ/YjbR family DNA-binding protein [Jatrophihabitantaceae bacterium]